VDRGESRRRFFDRISLPSRQKPGQDAISLALFLPNPIPKDGLPVRYGIAATMKKPAIVYLKTRRIRGNPAGRSDRIRAVHRRCGIGTEAGPLAA
jgi:hypothetical protein